MEDFAAIVDAFPSQSIMASDLGVETNAVRLWKHRNRIPAEYWSRLVAAAQKHGLAITNDMLAAMIATPSSSVAAE